MTILHFDTNRGTYHFEFSDLNAETQAHPLVEMVIATQGSFALESHNTSLDNFFEQNNISYKQGLSGKRYR